MQRALRARRLISYFGCGRYIQRPNLGVFTVQRFSDISEKIIPFFDKYPILGAKLKDYEDFKKVASLMQSKAHLTREGFEEILTLKQSMNRGRTEW